MEVAMVAAVVKSIVRRIRRMSRIWSWQVLYREKISLKKDKLESKINLMFLVEIVGRNESCGMEGVFLLMILEVCCGSSIRRNSILEVLRVR